MLLVPHARAAREAAPGLGAGRYVGGAERIHLLWYAPVASAPARVRSISARRALEASCRVPDAARGGGCVVGGRNAYSRRGGEAAFPGSLDIRFSVLLHGDCRTCGRMGGKLALLTWPLAQRRTNSVGRWAGGWGV